MPPVYILKWKTKPSMPERSNNLYHHFLGFFGLYVLILDVRLNGTICSSMESFSAGIVLEPLEVII